MGKSEPGKRKPVFLYILIAFFVLALFFLIRLKEMKEELQEHPPEEIALYLEQCFGLPCKVTYNDFSAFSDSIYSGKIPYIGEAVLEDGSTLTFSIGLDRAFPYLEGGLYTNFEKELLSHYASVCGIAYEAVPYYFTLEPTPAQIGEVEPALKSFLELVMDSSYIQNGLEISIDIKPEAGGRKSITLNRESPVDYEALSKELLDMSQ